MEQVVNSLQIILMTDKLYKLLAGNSISYTRFISGYSQQR